MKDFNRLEKICETLWEDKQNWEKDIENYLNDLSVLFERAIQLINIGVITEYTVEDVVNQIKIIMIGLEHHDNMCIADIFVGETKGLIVRLGYEVKNGFV